VHLKVNLKQMQDQREEMLEAVRYCILQADNQVNELKKQVKTKRENLEAQKRDLDSKKQE
jgi:hypothetical protein